LWLLVPGRADELDERRSAFASLAFATILGASKGEAALWSSELAHGSSAVHALDAALAPAHAGEELASVAARAWQRIARALEESPGPILVVLGVEVLQAAVALGFGLSLERADRLAVDPGRAVGLRDDPDGLVLRRINVSRPGPEPLSASRFEGP
jgi:broad specificity phosphatase PhoE